MTAAPAAPATRASQLETESAFTVAARVRQLRADGRHITDLSIGEPDLPTPQCIVEAGARALRDGATRYTPPAGLPELRSAIADDDQYIDRRERMLDEGAQPDAQVCAATAKQLDLSTCECRLHVMDSRVAARDDDICAVPQLTRQPS